MAHVGQVQVEIKPGPIILAIIDVLKECDDAPEFMTDLKDAAGRLREAAGKQLESQADE